jgi:hypothetical protein
VADDLTQDDTGEDVPLRDTAPWQAAAYFGAAFTPLTAIPLALADYDNAIPVGILAGAVAFVLGGLYLQVTKKKPTPV